MLEVFLEIKKIFMLKKEREEILMGMVGRLVGEGGFVLLNGFM